MTWSIMCELVLDNERRRDVADSVGLSFGRVRAIRRLTSRSLSMSELAAALSIDAPNATAVVDDLEEHGLVRRFPHPTDRRAKIVELTSQGKAIARKADRIMSTPPAVFSSLGSDDLEILAQICGLLKEKDKKVQSPH